MQVASIQAAQSVLLVVREDLAMTLLHAATWETIAHVSAPPFAVANDPDMPHASLDWFGEWVGIPVCRVPDTRHTFAFAARRFDGGRDTDWLVSVLFEVPEGLVDLIVPVPQVPAAWFIGEGNRVLYARVNSAQELVCDLVLGTWTRDAYVHITLEAMHPVLNGTAMLMKRCWAPEYCGGSFYKVDTWTLPDMITRDQRWSRLRSAWIGAVVTSRVRHPHA